MKITVDLKKVYEAQKDMLKFHDITSFDQFLETVRERRCFTEAGKDELKDELEEDLQTYLETEDDYVIGLIDL